MERLVYDFFMMESKLTISSKVLHHETQTKTERKRKRVSELAKGKS